MHDVFPNTIPGGTMAVSILQTLEPESAWRLPYFDLLNQRA